jgi:gas vesicle protein
MSKKSASTRTQSKPKLGDKIRNIADRLKQETEIQKKVTSRILGAAAQISANHEQLIDEVVEMVREDLEQQTQAYKSHIYTVEILKQQFKTLREAKDNFKLKATSWESLANKLNETSSQKLIGEGKLQLHQVLEINKIQKSECEPSKIEGLTVYLEADVAEMFPNSQAVNEALRFLIRVTNKNPCGRTSDLRAL